MKKWLARRILALFGWEVKGVIVPEIRKFIVIAAPHTSWWDFPLGVLSRNAVGRKIHFIGKSSLFKWPLGMFLRWMGGYPVERSVSTNQVSQIADLYREHEEFAIALAPEGTRKKVNKLKSGFYYIAREAGIPIIMARFDYANRVVEFSEPFWPGEDAEADLVKVWEHFKGIRGKRPELGIS